VARSLGYFRGQKVGTMIDSQMRMSRVRLFGSGVYIAMAGTDGERAVDKMHTTQSLHFDGIPRE
jgi:hypothetical protein